MEEEWLMFSYYGGKGKIVDWYPKPTHKTIIEPFAGSARYSLKWFDRNIVLVDKYDIIVNTWLWLQKCSAKDILGLPIPVVGQSIDDFKLSNEEKTFMGFIVQVGTTGLRKTVSPFAAVERQLKTVASQLYKIKHWKVLLSDYKNIENQEATWFIDPPYQHGGHEYKYSNRLINYKELSGWCRSRMGQVIVCENTKADWMDFVPMTKMNGTNFVTTEALWSNVPTDYNCEQMRMPI